MSLRRYISPIVSAAKLAVFALCAYGHTTAQGLYNSSSISIQGTDLFVDGEIRNTGMVENSGRITTTGDWNSQGNYKGNGTLELSGMNPQRIFHHGQAVSTLLINGWGTKYIKGIIQVNRELNLAQGIAKVSSGDELKLTRDATVVGGNNESYIDGPLTIEGTGYKFFPIGKSGVYAPIELLDVKGVFPEISMEVFEDAPAISVADAVVKSGLYWLRKDVRGRFDGSPVAIAFERNYFQDPERIILLTGSEWNAPFESITDVEQSAETPKIISRSDIFQPILMLGEMSERWNSSDFYFSTALSPNAMHSENRAVRIFGQRLSEDGFRFAVFNRRGERVYESNSLEEMSTNGWDGRSTTGAELPAGTYPYHLLAIDKMGKRFENKGVITLIY